LSRDADRPIITLRDIRHERGRREILFLDRLDVYAGQRLAVLGPNGAGKTSLLRLIAAVEGPTHGALEFDGRPHSSLTPAEQTLLRRHTAYLSQHPALLSTTVLRNVELPLAWRRVPRPERRRRAMAMLDRLGVSRLALRHSHTLSGGEAQRVALARALVTDPRMLLLDEPAAALDAESRETFLADLERVLGDDRTICVVHVSHRPGEALRLAEQVVVLTDGRVAQVGTSEDVLRAPASATVARLLGYENVVDVIVDAFGHVHVGNTILLTVPGAAPGPAVLAVWATGLHMSAGPGESPWVVTSVRAGLGRVEVGLDNSAKPGSHLLLHVPWSTRSPLPGDRVQLSASVGDTALISRQASLQ
jgi:ABC-type sulfate/molybdate transport systems ATPase subunit